MTTDYYQHRNATWNRESQFDELKTRGPSLLTMNKNILTPDSPLVLPPQYMSDTLINTEQINNTFTLPDARTWIKWYSLRNLVEPGAGTGWEVMNASEEFTLSLNLGDNVLMFDGSGPITVQPRQTKNFFVEVNNDIGGLTIYDRGGSTIVGPVGPAGPTGKTGKTGDKGDSGKQGDTGPPGESSVPPPLDGFIFISPSAASQLTSPPASNSTVFTRPMYLFSPNTTEVGGSGTYEITPIPSFNASNYEGIISSNYPIASQTIGNSNGSPFVGMGTVFIYPLSSVFPNRIGNNPSSAGVILNAIQIYLNVTTSTAIPDQMNGLVYYVFLETVSITGDVLSRQTIAQQNPGVDNTFNGYSHDDSNFTFISYSGIINPPGTVVYNNTNNDMVAGAIFVPLNPPVILSYNTPGTITNLHVSISVPLETNVSNLVSQYGLGLNVTYQLTQ